MHRRARPTLVRILSFACMAALVAALAPSTAEAGKREKAREAIRRADIDLFHALRAKDRDGFRGLLADDAAFYGGGRLRAGPDDVLEAWAPFFDPDGRAEMTWRPLRVEAATSGDLGFSIGEYTLRTTDEAGKTTTRYGHYVTIWRKTGGAWKAAVDIGTPPGAERLPAPPGAEER